MTVPDDVATFTDEVPCGSLSFHIDSIGVMIANLQYDCKRTKQLNLSSHLNPTTKDILYELWERFERTDIALKRWAEMVPRSWHPEQMSDDTFPALSAWTYKHTFDIYRSIQVASIWNTFRGYQLMIVQLWIGIGARLTELGTPRPTGPV